MWFLETVETKSVNSLLIIKTSSLGDIIQAFAALESLHERFPDAEIDWAVAPAFASIVQAHPFVHRTIEVDLKRNLWRSLAAIRSKPYDGVYDLQGNCKSGLLTLFAKSPKKVGFAKVKEWPNRLATKQKVSVPQDANMRLQYLHLVGAKAPSSQKVRFRISSEEQELLAHLLPSLARPRIMVCPSSKWVNKQLPIETWVRFLRSLEGSFLLVSEDADLQKAWQKALPETHIAPPLSLPLWQNLMSGMDLVLAVDSSALHLAGTTSTPSFSLFGPTTPALFKPLGSEHGAYQGRCPYGQVFLKQCPLLRTCPTGACIRALDAEELSKAFFLWHAEKYQHPLRMRSMSTDSSTIFTASSIFS